MKIEIKHRWTNSVLFELNKENNTLKDTVEEAVKKGVSLEGANLEGADLEGANLEGANLEGANLIGVDLRRANLKGANLIRANLRGANLEGADLEGANLEEADLKRATLIGTVLEGVNLRKANLEEADLRGTYIYLSSREIETEEVIRAFEDENDIEIIEWHMNRSVIPTRWSGFWEYELVICNWKKVEEMTLSQVCGELGRKIKIIEE